MTRTILACLLLSGCATQTWDPAIQKPYRSIPEVERHCLAHEGFGEFASCMQNTVTVTWPDWESDRDGPLIQTYFAWIQAAVKRVDERSMTEAEARTGAIELRTRLTQIANASTQAARPTFDYSTFLTGLALLEMSQPQRAYSPTPAPAGPITCTQYPTNRITGQTQIACR